MIISIPPRRDEGWRGGVASFWEKTSSPWRKSALDWNICATSGQGQPERGVLSRNTLTTGSTGVMGTRGGFSSCPACFLVTSPLARWPTNLATTQVSILDFRIFVCSFRGKLNESREVEASLCRSVFKIALWRCPLDDGNLWNLSFGILIDTNFWKTRAKFRFVAIYHHGWNFLIYRCVFLFIEIEKVAIF